MLISFRAVTEFLSRFIIPKSLEGIIKDCYDNFEESLATAKEIEDYRYLHHLTTNREANEKKFIFFWDYRHSLPTTLFRDQDFTIEALAKLAFDHSKIIPVVEWIELIQSIADSNSEDGKVHINNFNTVLSAIESHYRLMFEKIQRNEPCPCGSGKKYKTCHGALHA